MTNRALILEKYDLVPRRIREYHLRTIGKNEGPVFLISTAYPGVWLEHAFDGLCYASLFRDDREAQRVAQNQMLLFIRNQKPDGHIPYNVLDHTIGNKNFASHAATGFRQLQECVSLGSLCLETYELTRDESFLREAYESIQKWLAWQWEKRTTLGQGLIETFCVYDTGHDNSYRLNGIPNSAADEDGTDYEHNGVLPLISPDINAVFYGNLMALNGMAMLMNKPHEAAGFAARAETVKKRMLELLYDEDSEFFYDVDRNLHRRPLKTIAVTNVFSEHMLTKDEFDRIYKRYFKSPAYFDSPYPFPSMSLDDAKTVPHAEKNCWGYYSQALTALRAQRWMDYYGRSADYDALLEKWVDVYANQTEIMFSQELDPYTGIPTDCSRWYSSGMLTYIYAVKRLKLL